MKDVRKYIEKYLERLKNGDKCFTEFYELSFGYVEHAALTVLYDKSFVRDAIANTFMRVLCSIGTYDNTKNGYAWLYTVAKNEARKINLSEKAKLDNEIAIDWLTNNLIDKKDDIDAVELRYDIEKALETLDEDERRLVELHIFEMKTYKEMSAILGIPTSTVHLHVKNCLKKLLEFFDQS